MNAWTRINKGLWYVIAGPLLLSFWVLVVLSAASVVPLVMFFEWCEKYAPEKTPQQTRDDYYGRYL